MLIDPNNQKSKNSNLNPPLNSQVFAIELENNLDQIVFHE
jgi:hypothetical protein